MSDVNGHLRRVWNDNIIIRTQNTEFCIPINSVILVLEDEIETFDVYDEIYFIAEGSSTLLKANKWMVKLYSRPV